MIRSYQCQHLATVAAGFINAAGTTAVGVGCSMTRVGTGVYALVLPEDYGVEDGRTFTAVTIKGNAARYKTVTDTSDRVKTIRTFNENPAAFDSDLEVILFRSVESGR